MRIAIVGAAGIVGSAISDGFERLGHEVQRIDPKLKTNVKDIGSPNIVFVCVPSPQNNDGSCDTSIVESVVDELYNIHYTGIVAIKSTVTPGTTERLIKKYKGEYGPTLAFVPEFLRERSAFADFTENHDVCVVGTDDAGVFEDIKEAHGRYPKTFIRVSPTEAELVKYFNNVYCAAKVIFANGFYDVCKALGANYNNVKGAITQRDIVEDSYLDCNENFRGYAGPCVIPETKVYVENGTKRIDELHSGENVFTHDGTLQVINKVMCRKVKNERLFKIKGQGVRRFCITGEHPVYAIKVNRKYYTINGKLKFSNAKYKNLNFNWIDAKDLEKGDFIALPKFKWANQINKEIRNKDIARLLGYYAAEGYLDGNRVCFAFHAKEQKYRDDIRDIAKRYYNSRAYDQIDGNKSNVRFTNKIVTDLCLKHCGKYSHQKSLSVELLNLPDEFIGEFLNGYFRGDGTVSAGRYSSTTVSLDLHTHLKMILCRFGVSFNEHIKEAYVDKDGIKHRRSYWLNIANDDYIRKFNHFVDMGIKRDTVKFNRKTSWFNSDWFLIPIKSIEKLIYSGDVYNLEVDKNNTYVIEDAIVHNCYSKDIPAFIKLVESLGVCAKIFHTIHEDNQLYPKNVWSGMRPT